MSDTSGDIVQKTKKMQDLALDGICGTCVELNNESRGLFMHISRGKSKESKLSSIARPAAAPPSTFPFSRSRVPSSPRDRRVRTSHLLSLSRMVEEEERIPKLSSHLNQRMTSPLEKGIQLSRFIFVSESDTKPQNQLVSVTSSNSCLSWSSLHEYFTFVWDRRG